MRIAAGLKALYIHLLIKPHQATSPHLQATCPCRPDGAVCLSPHGMADRAMRRRTVRLQGSLQGSLVAKMRILSPGESVSICESHL